MILLFLSVQLALQSVAGPPAPRFSEQVIDNQVDIGYGIALGDVDGDGKPDILLADSRQIVWYRNGDWKKFVMADNLTQYDNVCIAARDLDGDGKVEVAVGAQWNPGETGNAGQSGSVHYLVRPADPRQRWGQVTLYHEPTIHRMRWVKSTTGQYYLLVLPLHGVGNTGGEGQGVNLLAYEYAASDPATWKVRKVPTGMHLTHNLTERETGEDVEIYIAGKEGVRVIGEKNRQKEGNTVRPLPGKHYAAGEIRVSDKILATIEPMHGTHVVVYSLDKPASRVVLDSALHQGHALGVADFMGTGSDQVVAGWRNPDKDGLVGVKIYYRSGKAGSAWVSDWIDKNGMACEDIQVADLNGDGKPDIVASGRATKNLKVYWNNR